MQVLNVSNYEGARGGAEAATEAGSTGAPLVCCCARRVPGPSVSGRWAECTRGVPELGGNGAHHGVSHQRQALLLGTRSRLGGIEAGLKRAEVLLAVPLDLHKLCV